APWRDAALLAHPSSRHLAHDCGQIARPPDGLPPPGVMVQRDRAGADLLGIDAGPRRPLANLRVIALSSDHVDIERLTLRLQLSNALIARRTPVLDEYGNAIALAGHPQPRDQIGSARCGTAHRL